MIQLHTPQKQLLENNNLYFMNNKLIINNFNYKPLKGKYSKFNQ